MSCYPVRGLPLLPGNTFLDPTKSNFHRSQTFTYKNGIALPLVPKVGIGGEPIHVNQLSLSDVDELANKKPTLTYGQAKQAPPADFIPGHVAFDKKVLKFDGYFKETVHESSQEYYRVRPIILYYYLEDDSIAIHEPEVDNSGLNQGKLINRQRLPKNDQGDCWHWKDLNVAMEVVAYGRRYHLTGCDKFTCDFMVSHGIIPNCPEMIPPDPYIESRKRNPAREHITPSDFDKLKQFLTYDRKVLRFYAYWNDTDNMFGECRRYVIHYYLADGTLEIRDVYEKNDGRDPFPMMVGRKRYPKTLKDEAATFPSISMEVSDQEVKEWYGPRDFIVGQSVTLLGREFFIYDCDEFTKNYFYQNIRGVELHPVDVIKKPAPPEKKWVPPYNGFGSVEDSLGNCLSFIPKPPKKDVRKILEMDKVILRYEAKMESRNPDDWNRRFILSFHVATDEISIFEPPLRNSGRIGGRVLSKIRIPKPGTNVENPEFYTAKDLAICSIVEVLGCRFIITDADEYVHKYLQANAAEFPSEVLNSFQQKAQERKAQIVQESLVQESLPKTQQEMDQKARSMSFGDPELAPAEMSSEDCATMPSECWQFLDQRPSEAQSQGDNRTLQYKKDICPPQNQGDIRTPQYQADICPPQNQGDIRTPQYQGGICPPQNQGDIRTPQYQGGICPPQNQGDIRTPQYQADICPPQNQGDIRPPQYQAGICPPQNQGDIHTPQYQGGIGPPQNQGDIRTPQYHRDICPPPSQGDIHIPQNQADISAPQYQAGICPPQNQADIRTPQHQRDICPPLSQGDIHAP
ncbi:EF-hand domain-containing protein 1 [Hemiscyllium ocellatum]|uniref:EF-hand domain-containing protein 1 n=1 Tax=Hemiscyllium ocellatum TaxID=170820 RepID=UPI0029666914|nr:EF-hand domain-containing protein 1 [Hemiscyllium ocellatum]